MKNSCALLFAAVLTASSLQAAPVSGEAVYAKYCASCHDEVNPRTPSRDALQKLPAARILRTLDFGLMMSVAYPLRREEREAVANFLGTMDKDVVPAPASVCSPYQLPMSGPSVGNWNGWSPADDNTRYQTAENADLTVAQIRKLKLKWAYGFQDDFIAFAAPGIVNGTLFVGSAGGTVQALDAKTGCAHWIFQASGPVRSAILLVEDGPAHSLVFSDQIGWVYSIDAMTGALQWQRKVEPHEATRLTGSPVEHDGVVFIPAASWEETRSIDPGYTCCTFRGSVTALRVSDGAVVWKTYMIPPPEKTGMSKAGTDQFGPSGAGIWSAPTIDTKRGVLYVTTGDNYSHPASSTSDAVVALDLKTGQIVWSQQTTPHDVYNSSCGSAGANCPADRGPDYDFGSSALLVKTAAGQDLLVAGQKSGVVYALNPDEKGKVVWQTRVGKGSTNGGVQWGMASDGQNIYAAVSDVVRAPGGIGGIAAMGNATLDPAQGGGITALRINDGEKVWFAPGHPCEPPRPGCSPAQPGAVTAIPGIVFSGSMDGHIRAFTTTDGELIWDFDTVQTYTTINGVEAKGGSLDGAGPIVSNGMVFVNSGYPRFGGMPGNVLLAFEPAE